MTEQISSTGTGGTSRELTGLLISLNVTRDFLTLVELLDALPEMQKTPYNVTRSLYQAVSEGRDIVTLGLQLEGFFGPAKKPAGKPMPVKLRFNATLKYLNGIREEQALYLRKAGRGFYYGALWPWHKKPGNITVHLGYCPNKMSGRDVENFQRLVKTRILNNQVFDDLSQRDGGMVQGISLPSFLHMAQFEKLTCTLEVSTAGAVGCLHLFDGELVAAESGSLKNKAAAYEILSWDTSEIALRDAAGRNKNEINQPLMEVLAEALRLRNDKKGKNEVAPAAAASVLNIPATDRYKPLREAQRAPSIRSFKIVAGALAALLVIGAFGIYGSRYLKARQLSREYRAILERVDAIEDSGEKKVLLQYFIDSHADTPYHDAARQKIRDLKQAADRESYEFVTAEVKKLPIDGNYEAAAAALYNRYLEQYPESPRAAEIQLQLAGIPALIDDIDYARLEDVAPLDSKKRIEAYLGYLLKHPGGRHRTQVEALVADMSEEYYGHLMKSMPQCDQAGDWDDCIVLCESFLDNFKKNYRTAEIENLKLVMQDKRDVAELMETVQRLGNKFESARNVLKAYLETNPGSTQAARIKDDIGRLDRNLRESREWQAAVGYSQNSQHSLSDRINYIGQYIRLNPSGRFEPSARLLLGQLQNENRTLYQERIAEQRKRQQLDLARERQRLETEKNKIAAQIRQAGRRFVLSGPDTFTDTNTGLTWSLLDSAAELGECQDFETARSYIGALAAGGYRDWRLPYGSELAELYKTPPYFPGQGAPWYWTAEVFAKGYKKEALIVTSIRENGFKRLHHDLNACGAVRAVRP
ncbi:MAG: DUF1566 domain-containing protein [Desulfobacterales bacterium]